MPEKTYFIYILTNVSNTVLYIGMTNNIHRRIFEHKEKQIEGFSKKYNCTKLIYTEESSDVGAAIDREKQLKKWSRKKKEDLIKKHNPNWIDLAVDW